MNSTGVRHFYKFRSLGDKSIKHVERILTNNELYFSNPNGFNDPFDCLPILSLDLTQNEYSEYLNDLYKREMPEASRTERKAIIKTIVKDKTQNHHSLKFKKLLDLHMSNFVNNTGVLSLSVNFKHVLMWSHYADSHKGICLRFKAPSTESFFCRAKKVIYQKDRPIVNFIKERYDRKPDNALITKADFWSYEEEWRIIDHIKGYGVQIFPGELLDGIIFGVKISDENRKKVLTWIDNREHDIEILEAKICEKTFRVVVTPI